MITRIQALIKKEKHIVLQHGFGSAGRSNDRLSHLSLNKISLNKFIYLKSHRCFVREHKMTIKDRVLCNAVASGERSSKFYA